MGLFWLCQSPRMSLAWSCKVSTYLLYVENRWKNEYFEEPTSSAYPQLCDTTIQTSVSWKFLSSFFQIFYASSYSLLNHIFSLWSLLCPLLYRNCQVEILETSTPLLPVLPNPPQPSLLPCRMNELPFYLTWASVWSWPPPIPCLHNHIFLTLCYSKLPFYKYLPISSLSSYEIPFLIHILISSHFSISLLNWFHFLISTPVSMDPTLVPASRVPLNNKNIFIAESCYCFSSFHPRRLLSSIWPIPYQFQLVTLFPLWLLWYHTLLVFLQFLATSS